MPRDNPMIAANDKRVTISMAMYTQNNKTKLPSRLAYVQSAILILIFLLLAWTLTI